MKHKINWNALVSAILSFLATVSGVATAVQAASYDPNNANANLLAGLIPTTWMHWIFVSSVCAKLALQCYPHVAIALNNIFEWTLPTTVPATPAIQPQAGAVQTTITK
jgi:hypothetical protein